jgi:predicted site-specific integrase-resolvase
VPVSANLKRQKINGVEVELFYIGVLAESLGRSSQTVRKWEISGLLPPPIFRDKSNRRMYSKEQIDTIVQVAEDCHVRQGYSVANTSFANKVFTAINLVNKQYFKKEGN